MSEVVKPIEVSPSRKIRVDLKESKPKQPTLSKDKSHDKPAWVCHFCGKSGHIRPNCYKLQVAKRANKPKVSVPQAQDPISLIGELVKALNFYFNLGVGNHSNVNTNSNARGASKRFWMQKTQSKRSLCFIAFPFVTIVLWFLYIFLLLLGFALHNIHAFHSSFLFYFILYIYIYIYIK